jgi:tellurite resistance protein
MEMLTAARSGDDPFTDEEAPGTKMEMGDATTYQGALIAALDDEVITEDEWAMLDLFRSLLGLQQEDHATIEEAIRSMAEVDEDGERRLERLQQYLVAHPLE